MNKNLENVLTWRQRFTTRQWTMTLLVIAALSGYGIYRLFLAPTPAERIERMVRRTALAAEAKSIFLLSDYFALTYADATTGADRAMLMLQAKRFFDEVTGLKVKIVRVIHEDPKLKPDATDARAVVVLQVDGRQRIDNTRFSGIGQAGGDAFVVGFHKRDNDWLIVSSRHLAGTSPEELMREINQK